MRPTADLIWCETATPNLELKQKNSQMQFMKNFQENF